MRELNNLTVRLIFQIESRLCPKYCGVVDRRRVLAYIFITIIEALVIPYQFCLFLLFWEPVGFTVACVNLVAFVVIQMMIWHQNVTLSRGLSAILLLVVAKISVDNVFCTFFGVLEDNITVAGNIFVTFIIAIAALSMRLNFAARVTSLLLVPMVLFHLFTQDTHLMVLSLKPILVGFVMLFYVYCYNLSRITRGLRQPREVSQEEMKALEMLSNLKDMTGDKALNLLERLSTEQRQRLVSNARDRLRKEELDNLAWDMICAELTASEKEICRLILEGHTLKEICARLNKTESNITSQRSHIRKKLNMNRTDDLRRTLQIKMAEIIQLLPPPPSQSGEPVRVEPQPTESIVP